MTVRVMNPEVYRGYEGSWRYADGHHASSGSTARRRCTAVIERGDEVLE